MRVRARQAMAALCNIIAKGDGIRTLVKTGGIESIVLAMRLHLPSSGPRPSSSAPRLSSQTSS